MPDYPAPQETGYSMETLRLAVIENQLATIATSMQTLLEKQESLTIPLQDQAIRLARVESKVDDLGVAVTKATETSNKAHTRLDLVEKQNSYVKGAAAAVLLMTAMISWALKDQLDMTRQLPVLMERQDVKVRLIEDQMKLLREQMGHKP